MHGSFTPESAEKFLQLMEEAGYETRESPQDGGLENFSASLNRQVDIWETAAENFSETRGEYIDNYDYTRCVRPDGSVYGTRGKCKKGTETEKASEQAPKSKAKLDREIMDLLKQRRGARGLKLLQLDREIASLKAERRESGKAKVAAGPPTPKPKSSKTPREQTPDEKWMQGRLETLKTLKGKSKKELISILNQHRKIHGLTERDSVRDIQGAILGSIHGNDSPTEIKEKRAARLAQIQRQRGERKSREEEQSAIDQLSRMLPKGENIMDSLGNISIATGGAK